MGGQSSLLLSTIFSAQDAPLFKRKLGLIHLGLDLMKLLLNFFLIKAKMH